VAAATTTITVRLARTQPRRSKLEGPGVASRPPSVQHVVPRRRRTRPPRPAAEHTHTCPSFLLPPHHALSLRSTTHQTVARRRAARPLSAPPTSHPVGTSPSLVSVCSTRQHRSSPH